jgi:glycosyltransferase involved in cell wall biosynthesis
MSALHRVSVLMPFLNLERFIEESIQSVLAQTYEDWELLLVDDGSTDGSAHIAREYASRHPDRIRYLTHPNRENRGASASRNLAIREARGELFALLDADDVWLPNKLAEQVPILDSTPEAGSLYGNTLYWHSWTGSPADSRSDYVKPLGFPHGTLLQPPALLVANLTGRAFVPCMCSILIRREVIERTGGFEESFKRVFTDQAFLAKVLLTAPVLATDIVWDKYRRHDDSCCAVMNRQGELSARRQEYLDWLEDYLTAQQVTNRELWAALHHARWPYRHPVLHTLRTRIAALSDRVGGYYWEAIVPSLFGASRVLLPHSLRKQLWARWERIRRQR